MYHDYRVTVIIPNYNHSRYLKERIDSVLNQTFANFEIIILDDSSSDDSKVIIENYRDITNVTSIMYNEANSGSPFKQWEKGIELASGKYIWIAESDDFAHPDLLATLIKMMESEDVGIAYCNSYIVNENGDKQGLYSTSANKWFSTNKWENDYLIEGYEELNSSLLNTCTIYNVSAVLFRTEVVKEVMDIISSFKYGGDWLAYMLIALKKKIAYCSTPLNFYRDHILNTTKISGENFKNYIERYYVRLLFIDFLKKETTTIDKIIFKKLNTKARHFLYIELRSLLSLTVKGKVSMIHFIRVLVHHSQILVFNKRISKISLYLFL